MKNLILLSFFSTTLVWANLPPPNQAGERLSQELQFLESEVLIWEPKAPNIASKKEEIQGQSSTMHKIEEEKVAKKGPRPLKPKKALTKWRRAR
tara:strand:- start:107 stop:388 length:282 start_codon:yes stop_codon:yes gene_type:complete